MEIRKMKGDDPDAVINILSIGKMAPVSVSREIPKPERSTIFIHNTFAASLGDWIVGVWQG